MKQPHQVQATIQTTTPKRPDTARQTKARKAAAAGKRPKSEGRRRCGG